MSDTRERKLNLSYNISTNSDTVTLYTDTVEKAATIQTKEIQKIDLADITEGIRNLTIDPMNY